MIKFKADVELDNGAKATEFIVSNLTISTNVITATVEGFVNDEKLNEALKKSLLQKEQDALIKEFEAMQENFKEMSEEKRLKLIELQDKINDLYFQIINLKDYKDFVIFNKQYHIEYVDKITEEYIVNEILKQSEFNMKGE